MKKFPLLFCLLILAACSKNEVIPPLDNLSSPASSVVVSHLCNDDLILVDGLIQLKISKEEALKRGVPASEYELMQKTLVKHNNGKIQTKSTSGSTLAWGALFYKDQDPLYYMRNVATHYNLEADGITLYYTFEGSMDHYSGHNLYYGIDSMATHSHLIFQWGDSQGSLSLPDFTYGYISLEYIFEGSYEGICIYEIIG